MAKYFIERGIVHVLSDKETEIERQKNKIEYQYGEKIHRMITEASRVSTGNMTGTSIL
jgi:ribosomal protein S18